MTVSFLVDDPELVSIATQSELTRRIVDSVLQSFQGSSLAKVRGKVALVRAILVAIQRERRLSPLVDVPELCLEIYQLVYSSESVNAEPVEQAELVAVKSMVDYLLSHDLRRGFCRRVFDALIAFFR